jgi:hypothetical protein
VELFSGSAENSWFGMSQAQQRMRHGWTGGLILFCLIAFLILLGPLSELLVSRSSSCSGITLSIGWGAPPIGDGFLS